MTTYSNLPPSQITDSALGTRLYFDKYGEAPVEFSANDLDSTVGFLQKRGFGDDASIITAVILLKQAKADRIPVNRLLDTLTGLENIQLSAIVGEILNNNRAITSVIGFRVDDVKNDLQNRNILI